MKHLEIVGVSSRCSCGREKSKFKTHYGKTKITFKERYKEHKQVFKNENSSMAIALLRYIHKLRRDGKGFVIKWSIKARGKAYQRGREYFATGYETFP